MYNELIYGKNHTDYVVSVEDRGDGTAEVFREMPNGDVISSIVDNPYSILFTEQHSPKMTRLAGDQPYCWLYETNIKEKYKNVLSASYKNRYDMHVIRDAKEAFMVRQGFTSFKGMKVQDVSVLSFDLETNGLEHNSDSKVLLISNTFRKQGKISRKLFSLDAYPSQRAMLNDWCNWVSQMNPSVIVGHHLYGFDLPYLDHVARLDDVRQPLFLGRDGSIIRFNERSSQFRKDGSQSYDYTNAYIYGREIVDTYFLALKSDIKREYESYGLKAIIKHEGLERADRQHYEAGHIAKNWDNEIERLKIKKYAEHDADDALALYDLMIPSLFYYAQSIPRSLQQIVNTATGSQINSLMVRAYLQKGYSIAMASTAVDYEGAISMGVPGIHKNVFKIDVSSLYPSIIRQYKIYSKDKDPQALFLKMVEYFTLERLKNKKLAKDTGDRYYKDLSESQKIAVNSMYGFLGAQRSNYNYPEGAAAVTRFGREILQKAFKWATGKEYHAA